MSEVVLYDKQDRIVTITLNKPETRNALSKDLCEALVSAVRKADDDVGVSCVILAASGKSFSSGGNLHEIKAMTAEQNMTPLQIEQWYKTGIQQIPLAMADISVPVIAAVNGHAIGAGNDLATMCDMRIAGEDAIFAESFLRVGIIPGDGGAWLLPRLIGQARANQMLFTGEFIDAHKALDYGLVSEVLPGDKLLERARELAGMVVGLPPLAIRKTKELVRTAQSVTLKENLDQAALFQGVLQQLEDHQEAIDAILEKRKPVFRGK
ncbi:Enoyl-CoA hydratase/carnithine racemase [Parasphingorhabdus marina DSM 22363]|uniref:Enoyl-CoA hydratase/carnithine racemase n=1 Tax=Parasphingorhabdus marina DSM 22363 TaxID=1123272 RepID=A0A1N6CMT6_9SPHN|nr:enoyl-CoA hydratase-related protein [Parasphingorhabdus marina]SIN59881.1 Enoyl-CoA hydratase/carnithine racemase [Parasphingorhabdus marina DSM 22363]